jgi:hypothetical protein
MITITAIFEIDEKHHYFDGYNVKEWLDKNIKNGRLTASIRLTEVEMVKVITAREYNAEKIIPQYNIINSTTKLKMNEI